MRVRFSLRWSKGWSAFYGISLARQDIAAATALFAEDAFWRDLVAFTWNIRTQEGPQAIREMLQARLADAIATIRDEWEGDPAEYVETKLSVSETKFNAWPSAVHDLFAPARTVSGFLLEGRRSDDPVAHSPKGA